MRYFAAFAIAMMASPTFASENLEQQLKVVAPLVNAGDFEALGGPETHQDIVKNVEGRWFTLNNIARNWQGTGAPDRAMLARAVERSCSDASENIMTQEIIGPDSFRVSQLSASGEDQGTFDMLPMEGRDRGFTSHMEDDYMLGLFDLTDADPSRQQALLDDMHARMAEGMDIYMPTADLMVSAASFEIEVWGRCPS